MGKSKANPFAIAILFEMKWLKSHQPHGNFPAIFTKIFSLIVLARLAKAN
jgi:hypothetical protein